MDALPANRTGPPSCSHGTCQHNAITSRSRQFLMMGTWLPETCWATSRREIKNTKVTSSWFFLSTLNYDAGQPHITFKKFITFIYRKRSLSHSRKSQQYLSVYNSLLGLNPAVTWSDRYTFKNAWLVNSTLWSLAQPDKRPHSLTNLSPAVTYLWLKKYCDSV